ncbi:hypothetical protein DUNSADRAFT_2600 [Dunaliella salina]|uniref:DNA helicase n=1 Tax=Dunaliella salina TaxID=3046 RepID=A0ABQ7GV93_DUNSA|nr:hypothetical protein DUNSADRAFT_2600 [Dunaliella salina]|eukprot:KAF5838539.1 hypothetical protein DUNSADRAFT_2600 [Dunaliella salina]
MFLTFGCPTSVGGTSWETLADQSKEILTEVCLLGGVSMNKLFFGDILNVWIERDKLEPVLKQLAALGDGKIWPKLKGKNKHKIEGTKQQHQADVRTLLSSNADIPVLSAADLPGISAPVREGVNELRQLLVLVRSAARVWGAQGTLSALLNASAYQLIDKEDKRDAVQKLLKEAEKSEQLAEQNAQPSTADPHTEADSHGHPYKDDSPFAQGKRLPTNQEEEQRLAYVAMTRAKVDLYLLGPDDEMGINKVSSRTPSPYLSALRELEGKQPSTVQFTKGSMFDY